MMAHFCEGEEEGGGTRMRDMLHAFPPFPRFAVLSPLIPWQTLMRLQLPGSANSTSIIHPVQLHPLNTPHTHITYTNMHALYLSRARIHAPFPFSPLKDGLTPRCHCHKSPALFIHGRPKIWAKTVQRRGDTWGIFPKAAVSFKNRLIA